MTPIRHPVGRGGRRAAAALAAMLAAACSAAPAGAQGPRGPDASNAPLAREEVRGEGLAGDCEGRRVDDTEDEGRRIETAAKDAKETPELAALARRPEIAAAFARYRSEGGLLPRLRFAEGHALTAGFANRRAPSVAALTLLEDLTPGQEMSERERTELRARPFAFDLACTIPTRDAASPGKPDRGPVDPLDLGGILPVPGAVIRISVDVPARVWRVAGGPLQTAMQGNRGTLVARVCGGLERAVWGTLVIDRLATALDDSRSVIEMASPHRKHENRFRAGCRREPFSRLFGLAGRSDHGARP